MEKTIAAITQTKIAAMLMSALLDLHVLKPARTCPLATNVLASLASNQSMVGDSARTSTNARLSVLAVNTVETLMAHMHAAVLKDTFQHIAVIRVSWTVLSILF